MTERRRVRRDRRDEIDDVALRIFCSKGFAATSVQDVADEVGVLKGSLYHYIGSKDELLVRIFDTAHHQLTAIIGAVAQLDATPAAQLRSLFERQVRWFLENPEQSTVLFREWHFLTGEYRDVVTGRRKDLERFIRKLIEQCQATGEIDPDLDVTPAMRFVLGAVNATPEWFRSDGADSPAHIAQEYAEFTMGVLTGTR